MRLVPPSISNLELHNYQLSIKVPPGSVFGEVFQPSVPPALRVEKKVNYNDNDRSLSVINIPEFWSGHEFYSSMTYHFASVGP